MINVHKKVGKYKEYIDTQRTISIDDIFSNYSKEDLIETVIGIEYVELYLRKKKLTRIKNILKIKKD